MPQLLLVISIIFLIVFTRKKRRKKKEEETNKFLLSQVRNFTDIEFPKNFFKVQYMGWMNKDVSDQSKIKSFFELKKIYSDAKNEVDDLSKSVEMLESSRNTIAKSVFCTSKLEWDQYAKDKSPQEIEDDLSIAIPIVLPLFGLLKCELNRLHKLSGAFRIIVSERNLKAEAQQSYLLAIEFKWETLCKSFQKYNTERNRKLFFDLAKEDQIAQNAWLSFFEKSFLNEHNEFGISEFLKKFGEFCENLENNHAWFLSFLGDLPKESALFEIEDFSEENINRIIELYKTKQITGWYSKARDPKYN